MTSSQSTSAQDAWFDEYCRASHGYDSLPQGLSLFHGYRSGEPNLDNDRSLWLTRYREEARDYSQASGALTRIGVLELQLTETVVLRRTQTSANRFLSRFDPDRTWPARHDQYARKLHQWGRSRQLPGIVEEHGAIVLFLAANYLAPVR